MTSRTATLYDIVLDWSFTLFSTTRLLTYLPTMWAIHVHRDSSQHSLLTWLAWVGSNATMAIWLYERNLRRTNMAVMMSGANALMCLATSALIALYR